MSGPGGPYRSKTLAAWLAVVGGALGLHRLYLRGFADLLGWLHLLPTGLGYMGVLRMRDVGVDDRLSWALLPIFGLMVVQGMVFAIVYGLTPDERWDARHNPGAPPRPTRWGPVLAVITAMLIGATVLMSTIAFGIQKFFEVQLESERAEAVQGSPGARK
jgi:hypothetical protein